MSKLGNFASSKIPKQALSLLHNQKFCSAAGSSSSSGQNEGSDGKKLYAAYPPGKPNKNEPQMFPKIDFNESSSKSKSSKQLRVNALDNNSNAQLEEIIPKTSIASKPKKRPQKFANTDERGLPLLSPKDCNDRVTFASKMLNLLEAHPELMDRIIFSDEGNFHLSLPSKSEQKAVKDAKKMKSFHSDALQRYGESQRMPQIVWCGMTTKYIFGPYFLNSYLTERTYLKMLRTYLIPQLKAFGHGQMEPWWFQQDGNPPHRTRPVLTYLQQVFGPRLISYGTAFSWPPRSQDLTPLDYWLWDHLKERLANNCCPVEDLSTQATFRKSLVHQIDEVDEKEIRRVVTQFSKRLELCIDANGERFDFDAGHQDDENN